MVLPLVVAIVAGVFGAMVLMQYRQRRRPYQLVWAIALFLGCAAGLSFVLFLADGRSVFYFRAYYVTGGLLMAAYLGLGEVYLLASRRAADLTALVVLALSIVGFSFISLAPIDSSLLHGSNVEAGTKAITGPSIVFIALLNTFGAVAVVGGAAYSAYRVWRRRSPSRFLVANLLIAGGTLLASLAGALARVTASGGAFWGLLAAGFVVLFAGFLLTTMPRAPATPGPISSTE